MTCRLVTWQPYIHCLPPWGFTRLAPVRKTRSMTPAAIPRGGAWGAPWASMITLLYSSPSSPRPGWVACSRDGVWTHPCHFTCSV